MAEVSEFFKRKANEAAAKKEGGTQWLEEMRNRTEEQIQADIAAANENSQQPKVHKGPLAELSGDRQEQPAGDAATQPKAGGIGSSIEDAMKSTFDSLRGKVAAPTAASVPQVRPAGVQPAGMLYGDGGKNPLSSAQKMRGAVVDKLNNLTAKDMLNAAQKEYDDYLQSDEYKQKKQAQQAAQGAYLQQQSGVSTMPYAAAQQQQETDLKEKELRAKRDYYQRQVNMEKDKAVMDAALAELETWSDEDKRQLANYVAERSNTQIANLFGAQQFDSYNMNPIVQKYGIGKVRKMAEAYEWKLNAETANDVEGASRDAVTGGFWNGAGHSTLSVGANVLGSMMAVPGRALEMQNRTGQFSTLQQYTPYDLPGLYAGTVRGQVAQNIAGDQYDENGELIKDGGVIRQGLAFAYQGGMSAADSIARAAVGGGGAGALTLAAMGSFGQTMSEASKQGATPTQALILATGTAALEAATEKIPLERMLTAAKGGAKGARAIAAEALKQAGIEVTTEEVSLLGSLLLEGLVLQEKSNYRQGIGDAIASGMSYKEAQAQADKAVMQEALQTLAVSGFAGLFSGAGSAAVGQMGGGNEQTPASVYTGAEGGAEPPEEAARPEPAPQVQAPAAQPVAAQEAVKTPEEVVLDAAAETGRQFAQPAAEPKSQLQQTIDEAAQAALAEQGIVEATQQAEAQAVEEDSTEETELSPEEIRKNLWKSKRGKQDKNYRVSDGWQAVTDNSVWATALAMKEVNPAYFDAYMAAAEGEHSTPVIDAIINAANDVRQESISPMAAATVINEVYEQHGEAGLRQMYNPKNGNLYESVLNRMKAVDSTREKYGYGKEASGAGIKGTGAAEANFSGKAAYQDLLTDENTQRDRHDDVRPMEVPKVDGYGRNVSETVGNLYGAKITTDEMAGTIEELVQEGALGFDKRSNQQALNDAAAEIAKKTPSAVEKSITANIARGRIQDGDIEKAMLLYNHYANKKGDRAQQMAAELVVDLATMGHMTGRNLQLFKLLRKLTPEGQVYAMKRTVEQNVQRMVSSGKVKADSDTEIDPQLLEDYRKAAEENMRAVSETQKAESEEKMLEIQQAIFAQVAGKMKGTLKSKWDAWRYMCMLGNGKTQIRNVAGNALFTPYKAVKDTMGAAFEKLLPQDQRTKALVADPELLRWAWQDAKTREVNNALKYTGKLGDDAANSEFAENVPVFDSKALETVRKAVEAMPQMGDMIFKNGYYAQSLAGFLKARGYKLSDIQNGNVSDAVMSQARGYAIQESMKATFNDLNSFSDLIVSMRFKNPDTAWKKAANLAMEGVLPFRRTPANIVARFAEYSPAGVVKGIADMATKVQTGKMSAATAIDEIAAGLTGTGAMVLGYFFAKGIGPVKLVGKQDDEDEKRQGHQAYALEITIDGETYSYKIDWAAPANLPLFVGANICQALEEKGADNSVSALSKVLNMTKDAFEPMLALSCMSSLNDLFESARYAQEGEVLYSIAADVATSYFTQGIPALLRQGYQASQKDKMTTFANDPDPMVREAQGVVGQIPIIAKNVQTEKRNAWGETERTESAAERIANAFFNPGTLKKIDSSDIETEIKRLNDAQERSVTPPDIPKKVSYTDRNGETHKDRRLSEEEYQTLAQTQGQTAKRIVENLIKSKAYQNLTDAQKAYAIQAAYDYAQEMGKRAALPDYYSTAPSWISGTQESDTAAFIARGAYQQLDSVVSKTVEDLGQGWAVSDAAKQDLDSLWNSYKGVNKAVQGQIMEQAEGDTKLYLEARKGGVDASEWMQAMGKLEKVQPIKGSTGVKQWQNYSAIANAGLDNAATDAMMRAYMDESAERKYNYVRNQLGYSAKDYATLYAGYTSGKKAKEVRSQWMQTYGISEQEAKDLYRLFNGDWKPWED